MGSLASRKKLLPPHKISTQEKAEFKRELRAYKDAMKSGEWKHLPYNEFLDLVNERPDTTLSYTHPVCPKCQSKDVDVRTGQQTCVGGSPGYDPNHHWDHACCSDCGFDWTIEYKGVYSKWRKNVYNVWYTKDNHILKGIPSCFESYIYTCKHCNSDVKRIYFDKGTRNQCTILCIGDNGKSYDTVFACQNCHREQLSTTDDYAFESPHRPRKPFRKYTLWTIYEEPGICVINDTAISRINL